MTFDRSASLFGVPASWTDQGEVKTAQVLFNTPTEQVDILEAMFDDSNTYIEYKDGDFTGLYEAVRTGETQTINVDGNEWLTRQATKDFDGKTFKIRLSPKIEGIE